MITTWVKSGQMRYTICIWSWHLPTVQSDRILVMTDRICCFSCVSSCLTQQHRVGIDLPQGILSLNHGAHFQEKQGMEFPGFFVHAYSTILLKGDWAALLFWHDDCILPKCFSLFMGSENAHETKVGHSMLRVMRPVSKESKNHPLKQVVTEGTGTQKHCIRSSY